MDELEYAESEFFVLLLDRVRSAADSGTGLQEFFTIQACTHACGGGPGSALGRLLLERLSAAYGEQPALRFPTRACRRRAPPGAGPHGPHPAAQGRCRSLPPPSRRPQARRRFRPTSTSSSSRSS